MYFVGLCIHKPDDEPTILTLHLTAIEMGVGEAN